MRTNMNHEELEASHILDLARDDKDIPESAVTWALRVLGDAIGLRDFYD